MCTPRPPRDKWCFFKLNGRLEHFGSDGYRMGLWCVCVCVCVCVVLPLDGCYIIQKPLFSAPQKKRTEERGREKRNLGINVSLEKIFNFPPPGVSFFLIILCFEAP